MSHKINAGTGIPSILLILVTMCLMTFCMLSLVTVKSDAKLTQKNSTVTAEYYAAEGKCEELLCKADSAIITSRKGDFYFNLKKELSKTEIAVCGSGENTYLYFEVSINSDKKVIIKIKPFQNGDTRYKIISHEIVLTKDWQGDSKTLSLYGS